MLVPCCQAEVAACLRQTKALSLTRTPLAELWRHPIHTREMGSQLTNVLRCLYLEACGYQVTVTELVGWEHSMKNELIIARYTGQKSAVRLSACAPSWRSSACRMRWHSAIRCCRRPEPAACSSLRPRHGVVPGDAIGINAALHLPCMHQMIQAGQAFARGHAQQGGAGFADGA